MFLKLNMKAVALFSGGKDSCLALHKAIQAGHEIEYLVGLLPEGEDAWMFHTPNQELLKRQAEEAGFALKTKTTKVGEKQEVDNLREILEEIKENVEMVVIGGIASSFQGTRIKKIADELGLEVYAPLWDYGGERLWSELLKEGFKVILTKISSEGISKDFLGKIIDDELLEKLKELAGKYKFDITGEGGDFETAVLFMPEFKKEIKIQFDTYSEDKYRHFLKIKSID
jgi:ABC transporter with metal-binding/Fe-S-binding domain ATP-binding protein